MNKSDLPIDLKERAVVERRRKAEKEKQSILVNNKNQLIEGWATFTYLNKFE
jgi:hypothetical protein